MGISFYECHWCDAPMEGIHKPKKPGEPNFWEGANGVAREICFECVEESKLWAKTSTRPHR